jgi:hypothetical protein
MEMVVQAPVVQRLVDDHVHAVVHAVTYELNQVWVRDAAERVHLAPEVAVAAAQGAVQALHDDLVTTLRVVGND